MTPINAERATGIEPATFSLGSRRPPSETPEQSGDSGGGDSAPATSPATAPRDPQLAELIEAWPTLAEPMRVAVLAIVRASGGGTQG